MLILSILGMMCGPRYDHREEGIASYYHPSLAGRLTASGEPYDPQALTAAHKKWPFGTLVLVQNVDNGKSVWVKINDRGPFVKNRIIDLSRSAADSIDMIKAGTASVEIKAILPDK